MHLDAESYQLPHLPERPRGSNRGLDQVKDLQFRFLRLHLIPDSSPLLRGLPSQPTGLFGKFPDFPVKHLSPLVKNLRQVLRRGLPISRGHAF
jgi:hypothetical protein